MIVRDRPNRLRLLLALNGSVLPAILPQIAVLAGLAAGVVWFDRHLIEVVHLSAAPFTVFGIALSLFLGFRNNAAYDRWWEARRLWGQLLADMRALGRESTLFVAAPARRERLLRLALAFLHLHRCNLRRLPVDAAARAWLGEARFDTAPHPPCAALDRMSAELSEAAGAGELDGFGRKQLSERLAAIAYAQAGCERIAATPLPFVYSLLVYRTSYLYCLLLPLGLAEQAGWLTPLFVAIVAYVFLGLAEVSEELAHPFGTSVNGLPLDAICRATEISLAPHLGLEPPEPLRPRRFFLS